MPYIKAFAIASVSLLAGTAHADWQYTRWGMSAEQVVTASAGQVIMLPERQRARVPPLFTAVSGEFQDGALTLRTVFSFRIDGGGLACVTYGASGPDDTATFKALLIKHFGPPSRRSGLPAIGLEGIGWTIGNDEINASFSPGDAPFAMQCQRQ